MKKINIDRVKNNLKDKKGMTTIEMMIISMIFIMLLSFLVDIIIYGWQYGVVSSVSSNVVRVVSVQSGVRTSTPSGYPGGSDEYETSSELYSLISTSLEKSGFKPGDYKITVNGYTLTPSSNIQVDYLNPIELKVSARYDWRFVSNFVPGVLQSNINSKKNALGEFKYNYNNWTGE